MTDEEIQTLLNKLTRPVTIYGATYDLCPECLARHKTAKAPRCNHCNTRQMMRKRMAMKP